MSNIKNQEKVKDLRILYVHYGDNWIRGSEVVLLDLLKSAKDNNYVPVLWCNSNALAKEAMALGVDVIVDEFVCLAYWTAPKWNFLQFFKVLLKAKNIIKEYEISLVHCNNGGPCQWMVPVCKFVGIPLLLHLHARYMYRDRLTLLFHGVDSIVGVSQCVTDVFKLDEFCRKRVQVIYNGLDPDRVRCDNPVDIRSKLSAEKNDFVILYVGSLISRKCVDQILYAIVNLKEQYNVKLAVVGSGCERSKLIALVNELHLHDEVKFYPPTDKVAQYYAGNADCFISVPSEEVFGLTLAEASLAKLPIITRDIPGINEIYTDKNNAMLIPVESIEVNEGSKKTEALIHAIKTLIESPTLRENLAENAQKHIKDKFSLNRQFVAFDKVYRSLLLDKYKQSLSQMLRLHAKTLIKAFLKKTKLSRN